MNAGRQQYSAGQSIVNLRGTGLHGQLYIDNYETECLICQNYSQFKMLQSTSLSSRM